MLWPFRSAADFVTNPDPSCQKQYDCTSHSWICGRSRSPRCLRNWAPGFAKRRRFTKDDWRTAILLTGWDSNLIYTCTTGCVASRSIDALRHGLSDLDNTR